MLLTLTFTSTASSKPVFVHTLPVVVLRSLVRPSSVSLLISGSAPV
uniref:Uncharacterized protein n=1 Tax=Arundo donax TaxID=35708 RepID=A0A0A9B5Q0_ARUDO